MAKYVQRGTAEREKEGLKNDWRWDWLDKQVNEVRVGDVFRKLEEKGFAFCVPCQKKVNYANRGFKALSAHLETPSHRRKAHSVKDNTTIAAPSTAQGLKASSSQLQQEARKRKASGDIRSFFSVNPEKCSKH